jgi:hypothetical protein
MLRSRPMPLWLIWWIVFCAVFLASPACLLFFAWVRNRRIIAVFIVPMAALIFLGLALIPETKSVLVGADYTRRLFVTIDVFIALTAASVIYAAIRKQWLVAIASALVSLGWIYMAAINSVV